MSQKQVMPVESLLKLLKPGRCLYIYGGEEHGFPLKPIFVQIVACHLDAEEVESEKKGLEELPEESREVAERFFSEPGLKILAQVTPEEMISTTGLENHLKGLKASRKKYPDFIKRYLFLRQTLEVPEILAQDSTPAEAELFHLHHFLQQVPKGLLNRYLKSDQERYTELKGLGIEVRTRNSDCQTDLELELIQLHRKLSKK